MNAVRHHLTCSASTGGRYSSPIPPLPSFVFTLAATGTTLTQGLPNPCAPAGARFRGICLTRPRRSRLSISIFSFAE